MAEDWIEKVANKLARYDSEKEEIKKFLTSCKDRWKQHLDEFGFASTCVDLNFIYGFGGELNLEDYYGR